MILRSASLGAVGFGAAFALVGLYFLGAALASLVTGFGISATLALLVGRGSLRFFLSVASAWTFSAYVLLSGGPLVGLLVVHLDEKIASVLVRLALLGALSGVVSWVGTRRWRARAEIVLAAALGLPAGLVIGSALLPLFISSSAIASIASSQEGVHRDLALSGAIGGALAGAVLGAVIGYHRNLDDRDEEQPDDGTDGASDWPSSS